MKRWKNLSNLHILSRVQWQKTSLKQEREEKKN
jgi:hypothetical protein